MSTAYYRPGSLAEAVAILADQPSLVVLAGGTDVYPARAAMAGWGRMRQPGVIDISRIPGLAGVEDRGDHWWIGATTTWTRIVATELPPAFDGLKQAARAIGGIQIQNRGTIAGNICTASPAGDSIPCLLALDARVQFAGRMGATQVPIQDFITGYRTTLVSGGKGIVTGVEIPKCSGDGSFQKLGARAYLVISIAMVAAVIETGTDRRIRSARIAVGACSEVARRLTALEAALIDRRADPAIVSDAHFADLQPIDDVRASGDYRRAAATQLVRDILAAKARASQRAA